MNLPTIMDIFMLLVPTIVGGVIGFQVYMFKSINALKEELNRLRLQLASDHLTKTELREMFKEQQATLNQLINLKLNEIKRERR